MKAAVEVASDQKMLDDLDQSFVSGNLTRAREIATAILNEARVSAEVPQELKPAFDPARSRLMVVWPAFDIDGAVVLHRMLVPQNPDNPFGLDLPGIGTLDGAPGVYEVFISADKRSTLVSVYASTREENPINQQIVDVAGRLVGPLFGTIAGIAGEVSRATKRGLTVSQAPHLYVTSSRVTLPFPRSAISVKSRAQIPVTPERFKDAVTRLTATLRLKELGRSTWARAYATEMARQAIDTAAKCAAPNVTAEACQERFDTDFQSVYKSCVTDKGCASGTPTDDDIAGFDKVDEQFRNLVSTGMAGLVAGEWTFHNRPPTHFAFGLTTGLVLKGWPNKSRVRLDDDGKVAADPLGRQVSMIVLNWSPKGYDPSSATPSAAERYRLFLGAVITPDFGVGTGVSALLVRGLALNAGAGLLFSRGLRDGDTLGEPPSDTKTPFVLARTPFVFVGASFNYK